MIHESVAKKGFGEPCQGLLLHNPWPSCSRSSALLSVLSLSLSLSLLSETAFTAAHTHLSQVR